MSIAAMNQPDTFDLMGVEVRLEFALEELRDHLETDPQAGPLVQWMCETVDRVGSRTVNGPEDVMANLQDLKKVREALGKLGLSNKEVTRHLDDYIRMWLACG